MVVHLVRYTGHAISGRRLVDRSQRPGGAHLGPQVGDFGERRGGILRVAVDKVEYEVRHVLPRRDGVPGLGSGSEEGSYSRRIGVCITQL